MIRAINSSNYLRKVRSLAEIGDDRHMRIEASKELAIARAERSRWPSPHDVAVNLPHCITYASRMGIARAQIARAKHQYREDLKAAQLKAIKRAARKAAKGVKP